MNKNNNGNKTNTTSNVTACSLCGGDCWRCWHADLCDQWNDVGTRVPIVNTTSGQVVGYR